MTERAFGYNTGIFYARVVDNKDPTENGRYKIRVYGVHDDETNVSDEHLPWAKSMMPVSSASLGGVGTSPTGMLANTVIMGMWMDKDRTIPMILGSAHGNKANTDSQSSAQGQTSSDPSPDNDVNALVRSTATQGGIDQVYTDKIQTAVSSHTNTFLPSQTYAGQVEYPYGFVHKTVAGHEFFINSTPGKEAIRITHPSGSYDEWTSDGKKISRSMSSSHSASDGDVTFSGKANSNSKLVGNSLRNVGGSDTKTVAGNISSTSQNGNITQTASSGSMSINSGKATNIAAASGNINLTSGNPISSVGTQMTGQSVYQYGSMQMGSNYQQEQAAVPSSSSSGTGSTMSLTPQGVISALATKTLSMAAGNTSISLGADGSMAMSALNGMGITFNPSTGLSLTVPGLGTISVSSNGVSMGAGIGGLTISPSGVVNVVGSALTFNGIPLA